MNRLTLAASIFSLLLVSTIGHAQSIARANQATRNSASSDSGDQVIVALRRLENHVIVYRSLADFEAGRKLGRVSLPRFEQELVEVTKEVLPMLSRMPAGKLKTNLTNALDSYRDGAFWWRQVDQPRVVHVSKLAAELTSTRSDPVLRSTIPYTVVIHWRQARKYLSQAEDLISR